MITDHPVKGTTLTYRVFEIQIRYYTVRVKQNGRAYSKRALTAKCLKYLSLRTSRYLGNEGLSLEQLAAFWKGASSQIQKTLNTVNLSSYDGYTYLMEVSMVVTPNQTGDGNKATISTVLYRDFKSLVRDRGRLIKDQSWLQEASRRARRLLEGGFNYED